MPSRLGTLCDRLLEAGWLVALLLIPLFFDPYSNRVFELDKAALLRSLALLMSVAWVIRALETPVAQGDEAGGGRGGLLGLLRQQHRRNPLALPALLVAATYALATAFSIHPFVSLFGSYNRAQGLYTLASYLVIFFVTASHLRTRGQLERTINVAIFASFPIALYGIIQYLGLDPLIWSAEYQGRTTAQLGNPSFLGAYLIMLVPLTLVRLSLSVQRRRERQHGSLRLWAPRLGYVLALLAQFFGIASTQSRGPWLGLLVGLFAFVVLWALTRGARRVVWGLYAAGAILTLAGIVALLLAPSWLATRPFGAPSAEAPSLEKLRAEAPVSWLLTTRDLIWKGAFRLILPHPPIWSPIKGEDSLNAWRPLVGYGPDTLGLFFSQVQPAELSRAWAYQGPRWDRAHNVIFDTWASSGLLGVAAYLLLITLVFLYGLRWLGLIEGKRETQLFLSFWLGGGASVALLAGFGLGGHFLGIALPAGFFAGFFGYLFWKSRQPSSLSLSISGSKGAFRTPWIVALISALTMHVVEAQFGIESVTTLVYFWFYLAVLVRLGVQDGDGEIPEASEGEDVEDPKGVRRASSLLWGVLAGLSLLVLGYEFLTPGPGVVGTLWQSLFDLTRAPSRAIFALLGLTWLMGGLIGVRGLTLRYAIVSLAIALGYWVVQALIIASQAPLAFVNAFTGFCLALLGGLLGLGGVLTSQPSLQGQAQKRPFVLQKLNAAIALILLLGAGIVIVLTNVFPVWADILYKQAAIACRVQDWESCIDLERRASSLQPSRGYVALAGLAYLQWASTIQQDPERQTQLLQAADRAFEAAQRLSPFDPNLAVYRAQLYWTWAQLLSDRSKWEAARKQARKHLWDALRLSPSHLPLYLLLGQLEIQLGNLNEALQVYRRAVQLDPRSYEARKYEVLLSLALGQYDSARSGLEALSSLSASRGQDNENEEEKAWRELEQALAYHREGQLRQALEAARRALPSLKDSDQKLLQRYVVKLQRLIERKSEEGR